MPSPEFNKGVDRLATQSITDPDIEATDDDAADQLAVTISDLVQVNELVSVQADMVPDVGGVSVDNYSIDGNVITLDLLADNSGVSDAQNADVDEIIVTARGY